MFEEQIALTVAVPVYIDVGLGEKTLLVGG